ncbi:chorismate-binding protein [Microseira wollei]|uniref:Menaquinone-specific isochorismate synthase n=1 Tax=Microseira wollei NIES-4236 TaxID=2530354 RepID=A0AAV3XH37_9CYAN|nr:chorismate-binding protein [Microseira wollei]GET41210.1 menaquinone-specific isochorismate synthase [Microseira wollei NIES-4236]
MKSLIATHLILKNLNQCVEQVGNYFYALHIPALDKSWIGLQCSQIVTYSLGEFVVSDRNGEKKIQSSPNDVWKHLRDLLEPEGTYFFMVSLDLQRSKQDVDLPSIVFVKPDLEICLDGGQLPHIQISAKYPSIGEKTRIEVHNLLANKDLSGSQNIPYSDSNTFSMNEWQGESDESFLSRITEAVHILKNQPQDQSKMVMWRGYNKVFSAQISLVDLYEKYTLMERNCAASHYFQMPSQVTSFGCSPENIFELINQEIFIDVIASTRKRSTAVDEDTRLNQIFVNDFKENKEHNMARDRSLRQLEKLCVPNSIKQVQDKNIRQLRHVVHLFSAYSGTLRNSLDYLDLLREYFPPLTSYPPSLVGLLDDEEANRFYGGMVGRVSSAPTRQVHCFNNLRSGLMKKNTMHIRGGVGVIKHSLPESELLEVCNKLRCLLEALTLWEKNT